MKNALLGAMSWTLHVASLESHPEVWLIRHILGTLYVLGSELHPQA